MEEKLKQTVAPSEAPAPSVASKDPSYEHTNSAGHLILQWLTYAFWGWTILAMSILLTTVLAHMITGADTSGFTPYGIAAVIVLLPISIICDFFYKKDEPTKKIGGASLVMVVHAVIFALLGIASLIGFVFTLVQLLISSSETKTTIIGLISTAVISVFYAAAFIRTLNPAKIPLVRRFFSIFMTVSALAVIVLGIIGPVTYERATKTDRLISDNISVLAEKINANARDNEILPASLDSLNLKGDVKKIVENDLVQYTPNTKKPTNRGSDDYRFSQDTSIYFYTLCVTYTKERNESFAYSTYDSTEEYSSYISAYSHPAGKVCYKVRTDY